MKTSYPEPVPSLKGKQADQFLKDLRNFKFTDEQMAFYMKAINRKDKP
jgi:hypothetical protein